MTAREWHAEMRLKEIELEVQEIQEEAVDGIPSEDETDAIAKLEAEAEAIKKSLGITLW